MKKLIKFTLTVSILMFSLSSCKLLLHVSTKNWKKELLNKETNDYKLLIKLNLSMGCPTSTWTTCRDSLYFNNCFLPNIIMNLTDKTASRTVFENMKYQKNLKFDINYYPKRNQETKASVDTLLQLLGKGSGFSLSFDSIKNKVYTVTITDTIKLAKHIDRSKSNLSRTRWMNLKKIGFYNRRLSEIFTELENNLKLIIDYFPEDKNLYKMEIPVENISSVIDYFGNECGIKLVEKDANVQITKVVFSKKIQ